MKRRLDDMAKDSPDSLESLQLSSSIISSIRALPFKVLLSRLLVGIILKRFQDFRCI